MNDIDIKEKDSEIAILMATYNGEIYLNELLDSLKKQTFTKWKLYVQDDLSTDGTMACLEKAALLDKRIIILQNSTKKGAMLNFMDLLRRVSAPYYMFCDHDDVWLPNKIEVTLKKMKEEVECHPSQPIIVHTDLKVVDSRLNEICSSFWEMSRIRPDLLKTFNAIAGRYLTTGCTMMINDAAKKISFPVSSKALMHDSWITCCVLKNKGRVAEVAQPTILYRQHGGNVVGARDSRHHYLINKIKSLRSVYRENKKYYQMLKVLEYGNFLKFLYYKTRYFVLYKK